MKTSLFCVLLGLLVGTHSEAQQTPGAADCTYSSIKISTEGNDQEVMGTPGSEIHSYDYGKYDAILNAQGYKKDPSSKNVVYLKRDRAKRLYSILNPFAYLGQAYLAMGECGGWEDFGDYSIKLNVQVKDESGSVVADFQKKYREHVEGGSTVSDNEEKKTFTVIKSNCVAPPATESAHPVKTEPKQEWHWE